MNKLSTRVIHMGAKVVGLAQDYAECLTRSLRWNRLKQAAVAGSLQERLRLLGYLYAITALLSITSTPVANAVANIDHLKIYAHVKLVSYKEFQCFNAIIHKESRWNYKARNHSHYGLGQMRSKHYGTLDPFAQIDRSIEYMKHRYKTPCKAWEFHKVKGYY